MTAGAELVRYLRQQGEAGLTEVFLSGGTAQEVIALASRSSSTPAPVAGIRAAVSNADRAAMAATSPRPEGSPNPVGVPVAPPAASTTVAELPTEHDPLREVALTCTKCGLAEGRTQVVFHDGSPSARVMVVGEAPGEREDATGLPFVGPAGRLLDLVLATVGLSRKDTVYIANVLKCRPPRNRDPLPAEIKACSPYLLRQIEVVRPEVILAVGAFAGRLLCAQEKAPLGRLRGRVHAYHGTPLVVTYHPAALLRNASWVRPVWEDVQLLRTTLDAG